jgi:hypothetical protein
LVIFQPCSESEVLSFEKVLASLPMDGSSSEVVNGFSETTGILPRLTVSVREMRVISYVALRAGSSQPGKALLAAVGWGELHKSVQLQLVIEAYLKPVERPTLVEVIENLGVNAYWVRA